METPPTKISEAMEQKAKVCETSHVLALLRELQMPIVTTLHTILREPNEEQRRVLRELIRRS